MYDHLPDCGFFLDQPCSCGLNLRQSIDHHELCIVRNDYHCSCGLNTYKHRISMRETVNRLTETEGTVKMLTDKMSLLESRVSELGSLMKDFMEILKISQLSPPAR